MGRGPRINLPGCIYHVINRGNNRQVTFKEEKDYSRYTELLGYYKEKYGFKLYSYVLMNNHIHLLMEVGEKGSISKIMQGITLSHTRYFNLRYGGSGHVWQGRFKSPLVGKDSFALELSRYIELNPVRAGVVRDPADYHWSSYAFHAYGKWNHLLDEHPLYDSFGKASQDKQYRYRQFVLEGIPDAQLKEIRKSAISEIAYSSQDYLMKLEADSSLQLSRGKRGRPRINRT